MEKPVTVVNNREVARQLGSDRRSPPTDRVVRVLRVLADQPGESLGLSEIARRTDMVKATCLAVANELVRAGYLAFDAGTKRYGLGPELIALGFAAQQGYTALRAARARIDDLASALGFSCTVSAIVDGAHVVLAKSGTPDPADPTARVGQRFPVAPPWGTANLAWASDDVVEEWLQMQPIVQIDVDRDSLWRVIRAARRDGAIVELATELGARLSNTLAQLGDGEDRMRDMILRVTSSLGYREYLVDQVNPRKSYRISMIGAPTFDREGRQELLIALFGYRQVKGDELQHLMTELQRSADDITDEVGGHDPWKTR